MFLSSSTFLPQKPHAEQGPGTRQARVVVTARTREVKSPNHLPQNTTGVCKFPIREEGLTRNALRKYTSFGVHLAVKQFGARSGIHPSINRFSVTLRLSFSESVLAIHPNINRFSVHLAVKHFGARPGMHPNIDRFSVHTGVPVVWNGRVCWCSRRVDFKKESRSLYVWPGINANRRLRTVYRAVQVFRR